MMDALLVGSVGGEPLALVARHRLRDEDGAKSAEREQPAHNSSPASARRGVVGRGFEGNSDKGHWDRRSEKFDLAVDCKGTKRIRWFAIFFPGLEPGRLKPQGGGGLPSYVRNALVAVRWIGRVV